MKYDAGKREPEWKLDYIREHASEFSAPELARKLEMSIPTVYSFCYAKGINLKKRPYYLNKVVTEFLPVHQKIVRLKPKEPLVRPKAKYDNKSREERISELLAEGTNNY